MPFKLRHFENGTTGMVALCDFCGASIKAGEALVIWYQSPDGKPGEVYSPFVSCGGAACKAAVCAAAETGKRPYFQNFSDTMVHLMANTQCPAQLGHIARRGKCGGTANEWGITRVDAIEHEWP